MKFHLYILSFFLLLIAGCRKDFDFKMERMDSFGQDFVKMYGWPHARQNWNTAKQHKVRLSFPQEGEWNVKVFSADPLSDPTRSYLLGSFTISSDDNRPLMVDGPYTLENICVAIGNENVSAKKNFAINGNDTIHAMFDDKDLMPGIMPNAPKMSYLIAYEVADSSNTYLDFNDIVLEVVHVSGESTADLKLRAVGAKESMQISFHGNLENSVIFEDALGSFGYFKPVFVVNVETGQHDFFYPIVKRGIEVGQNFSIVNDAYRFVVTLTQKGKLKHYEMAKNEEEYLGMPPHAFLVANPKWDWVSENDAVERRHKAFPYWLKAYRKHNTWWDTLWDRDELMMSTDQVSYHPDYDYSDMIHSAKAIEQAGGKVPDIDYQSLKPYTNGDIGANLGFSIVGRNGGKLKISLERLDGGPFEWYPTDDDGVSRAYVEVSGKNINVDAGVGNYAESCHILLSTKTIKQIINEKTALRVIFDSGETDAKINSVWIRNR